MSTSLARPLGVMMMLEGLMSRWTTPRLAAWARPAATDAAQRVLGGGGSGQVAGDDRGRVVAELRAAEVHALRGRSLGGRHVGGAVVLVAPVGGARLGHGNSPGFSPVRW